MKDNTTKDKQVIQRAQHKKATYNELTKGGKGLQ